MTDLDPFRTLHQRDPGLGALDVQLESAYQPSLIETPNPIVDVQLPIPGPNPQIGIPESEPGQLEFAEPQAAFQIQVVGGSRGDRSPRRSGRSCRRQGPLPILDS